MRNHLTSLTASAIIGLLSSVPTSAVVQAQQSALAIADNDSVYIDAKTFQVVPGKGKGDAGAQIKNLAARELGPGTIIIRSGDKLYIAEGQAVSSVPIGYAYDPRQFNPQLTGGGSPGYNQMLRTFAYDPRQFNPQLTGGGSPGYNKMVQTFAYDPRQSNPQLTGGGNPGYNITVQVFAYDPRQSNPQLTGSGSPGNNNTYAYDPRQFNPQLTGGGSPGYNNMLQTFAYDPAYVQYRLKKAFEENWTPDAK